MCREVDDNCAAVSPVWLATTLSKMRSVRSAAGTRCILFIVFFIRQVKAVCLKFWIYVHYNGLHRNVNTCHVVDSRLSASVSRPFIARMWQWLSRILRINTGDRHFANRIYNRLSLKRTCHLTEYILALYALFLRVATCPAIFLLKKHTMLKYLTVSYLSQGEEKAL